MSNYPIDKVYNDQVAQLTTSNRAHADTFNPLFKQLINNDASLKDQAHSHNNKTTLDGLSDDGTNLLFNGSRISGVGGINLAIPLNTYEITVTIPTQQDTQYGVLVSPSWGTAYGITAKTTTSFKISFTVVSPSSGSPTVDWKLFR